MRFPHRLAPTLAIGLLFITCSPAPAVAAFRLRTGAGPDNLWTTGQNWQDNAAPAADDTLSFPASDTRIRGDLGGALNTSAADQIPHISVVWLEANGRLDPASLVAIGSTGMLTGVGNVGVILGLGGRFRPGRGDGLGTLSSRALTFSSGLTFDVVLLPSSRARLDVQGTVNLGNGALALQKIDGVLIDTPIVLIDNDGSDAIIGTFAGLPEGSFVNASDQQFRISHIGGTGNDVVVTPTELTYFLPEGSTGAFFDTEIAIANPHQAIVPVTVEFLVEAAGTLVRCLPASGPVVVKRVEVPANGRVALNIETQDESLANVPLATDVASSLPIVVERAQYWPDPAPQWYEAHNSFGVTHTWPKWELAEGRVGGPSGYQTYILLANPSANTATATITFLRESGTPIVKQFTVNPASRLNVSIGSGSDVPELTNERFGALIESNVDIAVERALYANSGSQLWGAGTNATATRLP